MSKPIRVQLRRTKEWRMPDNTVKVDRSSGFGNPFRVTKVTPLDNKPIKKPWWMEATGGDGRVWMFETKQEALEAAVYAFRTTMTDTFKARVVLGLKGKNLACWCASDAPCHADVLLEIANA